MKKLNLSLVAILAMGTFSMADSTSEIPVLNEFYVGVAYGILGASYEEDFSGDVVEVSSDEDYSQAMLQVGYKINPYFAFEGRYWIGMSDASWENTFDDGLTAQVDTWGLYGKFLLPVVESFNIYALAGYAAATYTIEGSSFEEDNDAFDGFSWGVGADFSFSDNMGIFVDYVALYDDSYTNYRGNNANILIDSLNFGLNYTF